MSRGTNRLYFLADERVVERVRRLRSDLAATISRARAGRLLTDGLKVAIVEDDEPGGVCLNWGCVPSKALITVAERYQWARSGASRRASPSRSR